MREEQNGLTLGNVARQQVHTTRCSVRASSGQGVDRWKEAERRAMFIEFGVVATLRLQPFNITVHKRTHSRLDCIADFSFERTGTLHRKPKVSTRLIGEILLFLIQIQKMSNNKKKKIPNRRKRPCKQW